MVTGKAGLLLSLLTKRPLEFYDRVLTFLDVRLEKLWAQPSVYAVKEWQNVILGMEQAIGEELSAFLDEPACDEIAKKVRWQADEIRPQAPFSTNHNADITLARLCYVVCRAIKPMVVMETGVAYGVTSAFILQAMEINGKGILHSVDLPPLGRDADQFVGILIPEALRHRWRLHRGVSKRVLPPLLSQLGTVDIFVHDSLHTYRNMQREFRTVEPYLAPLAVVIAQGFPILSESAPNKQEVAYWQRFSLSSRRFLVGLVLKDIASPCPAY